MCGNCESAVVSGGIQQVEVSRLSKDIGLAAHCNGKSDTRYACDMDEAGGDYTSALGSRAVCKHVITCSSQVRKD